LLAEGNIGLHIAGMLRKRHGSKILLRREPSLRRSVVASVHARVRLIRHVSLVVHHGHPVAAHLRPFLPRHLLSHLGRRIEAALHHRGLPVHLGVALERHASVSLLLRLFGAPLALGHKGLALGGQVFFLMIAVVHF
jgi:hypothetical protein